MIDWIYRGKPYTQVEEKYEAFVYIIFHKQTKKFYIGKKNFWFTLKRKPKKGNTNKRHEIQETKWREYTGSSEALLKDIETFGEENFRKEILILCTKKSIATYFELYLQIQKDVLFCDNSYNNIINIRICGNNFINTKEECKTILEDLKNRYNF